MRQVNAANIHKRKPYEKFSDKNQWDIGKYCSEHGAAATIRHFKSRFPRLKESTARTFSGKYRKLISEGTPVATSIGIPSSKRGRKLLIGDLDKEVMSYIYNLREVGAVVNAKIAIAAAKGIVKARKKDLLDENGGHVTLGRGWAKSLFKRMNFVRRKKTTAAKPKMIGEVKDQLQRDYLRNIYTVQQSVEAPPELLINVDQTPIKMVPVSDYTMNEKGGSTVSVIAGDDKKMFTAVFSETMSGTFLPMQLIYGGKTERCHPKMDFPEGFHVTHNSNHWSNTETTKDLVTKIIAPYVENVKREMGLQSSQKAIVIWDTFKGQNNDEIRTLLTNLNLVEVVVPANTTSFNQPLDVSVNRPCKHYMREKFEGWYAAEVEKKLAAGCPTRDIKVDMGIPLMREKTSKWLLDFFIYLNSNPSIILNGWRKCGITNALENGVPSDDPFA